MDSSKDKLEAREAQAKRTPRVLKTAHIPGSRRKPKFQAPKPVQIVIADDIDLGDQNDTPNIGRVSKYEEPLKYGDIDKVKSIPNEVVIEIPVAESESVAISDEETAEPQAGAASEEEIGANSDSDKPKKKITKKVSKKKAVKK